jgi:hypothetical protein
MFLNWSWLHITTYFLESTGPTTPLIVTLLFVLLEFQFRDIHLYFSPNNLPQLTEGYLDAYLKYSPMHGVYVQGAGGPNHYPLCRTLYAFALDACFNRDEPK